MSETQDLPSPDTTRAGIDPEFLSILRCPLTYSKLKESGNFLIAEVGGLKYQVRDGIPVMLIEEAILPADCKTLAEFKQKYCSTSRGT